MPVFIGVLRPVFFLPPAWGIGLSLKAPHRANVRVAPKCQKLNKHGGSRVLAIKKITPGANRGKGGKSGVIDATTQAKEAGHLSPAASEAGSL